MNKSTLLTPHSKAMTPPVMVVSQRAQCAQSQNSRNELNLDVDHLFPSPSASRSGSVELDGATKTPAYDCRADVSSITESMGSMSAVTCKDQSNVVSMDIEVSTLSTKRKRDRTAFGSDSKRSRPNDTEETMPDRQMNRKRGPYERTTFEAWTPSKATTVGATDFETPRQPFNSATVDDNEL